GGAVGEDVLDDVIDDDVGVSDGGEDMGNDARAVGDAFEGDAGEVFFEGATADNDMFHGFGLRDDHRAGAIVLAVPDGDRDIVFLGESDGTGLKAAGAHAGEFHHLIVGDFLDELGAGDDARVRGEDAIDVGVVFADVGLEHGTDGDERGVAPAAAERRDVAVG